MRGLKSAKLSTKIVAMTIGILGAGCLISGFLTYWLVWNSSIDRLDEKLYSTADGITMGGSALPSYNQAPSVFNGDFYVEFVSAPDADGMVTRVRSVMPSVLLDSDAVVYFAPPEIDLSESIESDVVNTVESVASYDPGPEDALPWFDSDPENPAGGFHVLERKVEYPNWRVIKIDTSRITKTFGSAMFIGLPLDQIESDANILSTVLIFGSIFIVLAGGIVSLLLVRSSLKPLRYIENTAQTIANSDETATNFNSYIEPTNPPNTEIGSLEISLNAMLQKINASFERQKATEAGMRKFISDSSHELRTPLSIIAGYLELYKTGNYTTKKQIMNLMDKISNSSQRMNSLVNDLLTLSRLDESENLKLQSVNLKALATEAVENLQALDPERPIEISFSPAKISPIKIDEEKINQVFTNLIGNIHRYTEPDVLVEIKIEQLERQTLIEIADHGKGVPKEFLPKMFDRFSVLDNSRSQEGSGSGLGMAIVKSIIQLHKGSITASATPRGGLTLRITLPNN